MPEIHAPYSFNIPNGERLGSQELQGHREPRPGIVP